MQLRSKAVFSVGCCVIHIKSHMIQCGELQKAVFSPSEKCRFHLIPPFSSSSFSREEPMETGSSPFFCPHQHSEN